MNEIYKLMDDENRAAEAIASGVKKRPNYKDRQAAMKIVQKFKLSGEKESDVVKGGSSRKVVKGKNIPGGLFKKGGMKTKFDEGGVKGGKVINETKIVDIPTPMLNIYNKGLQEMKKYKKDPNIFGLKPKFVKIKD